jgi:MFS family permease
MSTPNKPPCGSGSAATASTFSDLWGVLTGLISLGSAIGTIIGFVAKFDAIMQFISGPFSLWGLTAGVLVWLAAVVTFVIVMAVIVVFFYKNCIENPAGLDTCSAGVIKAVFPSFSDWTETVFPFTANHPRIDVVVKSKYWPLVGIGGATVVCNNDAQKSPVLSAFFHNSQVCGAGVGAIVGAAVGGIAGIFLAVIAAGAIGCTGALVFYLLCLLLVIVVAAIIVAVMALAGAAIGGGIGRDTTRANDPTRNIPRIGLTIGDYVTTPGNLIISGDLGGARTYWFVGAGKHATHGRSRGTAPFSHLDPDDPNNFPMDAC